MLLMTMRHKSLHLFVWLLSFLTFYLGFNQQVMCFELKSTGEVSRVHLQLIECNPLSAASIPSQQQSDSLLCNICGNGCPACKDFHLSFKRKPDTDLSAVGAVTVSLLFEYKVLSNNFFQNLTLPDEQTFWTAFKRVSLSNLSLSALRTTILLI